jgi:hypothetical protein
MDAITLFFILLALVTGLVGTLYAVALARRRVRRLAAGEQPAWPRYHVRGSVDGCHHRHRNAVRMWPWWMIAASCSAWNLPRAERIRHQFDDRGGLGAG